MPRGSGVGRGGETVSGAKVYKPEDTIGKQLEKSSHTCNRYSSYQMLLVQESQ